MNHWMSHISSCSDPFQSRRYVNVNPGNFNFFFKRIRNTILWIGWLLDGTLFWINYIIWGVEVRIIVYRKSILLSVEFLCFWSVIIVSPWLNTRVYVVCHSFVGFFVFIIGKLLLGFGFVMVVNVSIGHYSYFVWVGSRDLEIIADLACFSLNMAFPFSFILGDFIFDTNVFNTRKALTRSHLLILVEIWFFPNKIILNRIMQFNLLSIWPN